MGWETFYNGWDKMLIKGAFIAWIVTITFLAVMPHKEIMVKTNVTPSGMEKHVAGYFVGAWLLYLASRYHLPELRDKQRRKDAKILWVIGGAVFGYSLVLEVVQFFLPYRTFNPYDIVGNGVGVGAFCLIFLTQSRKVAKKQRL